MEVVGAAAEIALRVPLSSPGLNLIDVEVGWIGCELSSSVSVRLEPCRVAAVAHRQCPAIREWCLLVECWNLPQASQSHVLGLSCGNLQDADLVCRGSSLEA